ncbi:MAG: hypothetical protein IIV45_17750 [Lachnospiraceae bacterium]|nr:hypothetical protein [Lachnospiraceae bacterium]
MGEEQIIKILPQSLRKHFGRVQEAFWRVRQIRLRVNMPAIVELSEGEFYLGMQGEFLKDSKEAWIVRKEDVEAFTPGPHRQGGASGQPRPRGT